jgi:hypothetical protein
MVPRRFAKGDALARLLSQIRRRLLLKCINTANESVKAGPSPLEAPEPVFPWLPCVPVPKRRERDRTPRNGPGRRLRVSLDVAK